MLKRQLFVLLILSVLSTVSYAQKLDYVLGEVLVEIPLDENIQVLSRKLYTKMTISADIRYHQLIAEPMNIWSIKIDPNKTNENTLLAACQDIDIVLNAQRNHITSNRSIPDDPSFGRQWQYINDGSTGGTEGADLDMDLAWDITTGGITADGDTIVVCVIDDGINLTHPDIVDNLWFNHGEIPGNGIDDDNNGYIDDYNGWNAYNDTDVIDGNGSHGTPVSGIIAAKGNNSLGVAGINWDIKLMTVVGGSPESTALISYGYAYAQRKRYNESNGVEGAFVVATNSSWGVDRGQPEDAPIWCDFYNVMGEEGILSCGATANRNFNIDVDGDLPTACTSDYLISVTNLNINDSKVNQAGYGKRTIDIGAYGEDTYTITRNDYGAFGGTSGATPHVAGVVALAYATDCQTFMDKVKTNPSLTALSVKDMILTGNTTNESLIDISVTNGRLNANNTLLNMISLCEDNCSEAYGVTVDNIDIFDANVNFLKFDNQGIVTLRYRVIDTSEWTVIDNQEAPFSLSNLESCAEYEYQIATECSDTLGAYTYSKVFKTKGCCESPAIESILIDQDVATISWTNIFGANQYTIEYKTQDSNEWQGLQVDENTQTITIPNVEDCTLYDVRIKATCEVSDRESDFITSTFSGPCGSCTVDYCEIPAKNTTDEWIESVSIQGVFENVSGDDNGMGFYIGAFDIQLKTNQGYSMSLTPGYSGMSFFEFFSVYIDMDHSGDFSDDELLLSNTDAVSETFTNTLIIPESATLGITRMRVIMRYNESNSSGCNDDSWEFGEFEDYCVELLEGDQECPESLAIVSEIDSTINSLGFSFSTSSFLTMYNVSYRAVGETDFTNLSFSANQISIENLSNCTEYELRYSGICSDGNATNESTAMLKTRCGVATYDRLIDKLSIFPTPSYGQLTIDIPSGIDISNISFYNNEGRLVYKTTLTDLDLTNQLQAGVYFLKLDGKKNSVIRKWVKF